MKLLPTELLSKLVYCLVNKILEILFFLTSTHSPSVLRLLEES